MKTLLVLAALLLLAGCGDDDPAAPAADTTPPADVVDLHVSAGDAVSVTLAWTAPGDDGDVGTASEYAVRHAAAPLTEANWNAATSVFAPPVPAAAGTEQSVVIQVPDKADLYEALKTVDDAGNWSGLSNVVAASAAGPGRIRQLTSTGPNSDPCLDDGVVTWVAWTAGGDEICRANLRTPSPAVTVLTDNGGSKRNPSAHGTEKIVWQGREADGDDWEIWVWSSIAVPRFRAHTDDDVHDMFPVLCGGGDYAWLSGHTMFEQVRYWDEASHSESSLSEACCPTTEWSHEAPVADDGVVIWRAWHRAGLGTHKTLRWDGTLQDLTAAHGFNISPNASYHGGYLAWDHGGDGSEVVLWDGARILVVAHGYDPDVHAGKIAFRQFDGHDWEILYWDGENVLEITDNDYDDSQPTLDDGLLAWQGRPGGGVGHIFYVELDR